MTTPKPNPEPPALCAQFGHTIEDGKCIACGAANPEPPATTPLAELVRAMRESANDFLVTGSIIALTTLRAHALVLREDYDSVGDALSHSQRDGALPVVSPEWVKDTYHRYHNGSFTNWPAIAKAIEALMLRGAEGAFNTEVAHRAWNAGWRARGAEGEQLREALEIVKHMPHCMYDLACKLSHSPIAEDAIPGKPSVCPCYHCRLEHLLASAEKPEPGEERNP